MYFVNDMYPGSLWDTGSSRGRLADEVVAWEHTVWIVYPPLEKIFSARSRSIPLSYADMIDGGKQEAGSQVVTELEKLILVTYMYMYRQEDTHVSYE